MLKIRQNLPIRKMRRMLNTAVFRKQYLKENPCASVANIFKFNFHVIFDVL